MENVSSFCLFPTRLFDSGQNKTYLQETHNLQTDEKLGIAQRNCQKQKRLKEVDKQLHSITTPRLVQSARLHDEIADQKLAKERAKMKLREKCDEHKRVSYARGTPFC